MSTVELLQYLTEIGSNYSSRFIPYENIGSLENKQIVEQVFGFILAIQICVAFYMLEIIYANCN